MFQKFKKTLQIFTSNFGLFSLIVLTVWLPGNIFIEYLNFYFPLPKDSFREFSREVRVSNFIEGVFAPIYISAIIYSLSQLKQNRKVKYSEAIFVGLRYWNKLFAARFWVCLWIVLGVIGFVIPGIIIAVQYALIDSVVVLEGVTPVASMKRSTKLTKGKRWQIFGAAIIYFLFYLIFVMILSFTLELIEQSDNIIISIFFESICRILIAGIVIVMFLFYWEAKQEELDN